MPQPCHSRQQNDCSVKVKLDEGLSYRLKPALQEMGHDVDTVVDEGLKSEVDIVLADVARRNNRMLFTLDRGLGDVRQYVPGEHPGIIVFRLNASGPGAVSRFVEEFVRVQPLDELTGCLVIVEPGKLRIIRSKDDNLSSETMAW
jgi:predicted nuclease of predicted toxin-antitoxin system